MYQALIRFLHTLGIPIVAIIRDSQNYVRAAEAGIGVHEMKSYVAQADVEQWAPLVTWLTGTPDSTLSPRGTPPAAAQEPSEAAAAEGVAESPPGGPEEPPAAEVGQPGGAAVPEGEEQAVGVDVPEHAAATEVG
jgi:hypothetical protein